MKEKMLNCFDMKRLGDIVTWIVGIIIGLSILIMFIAIIKSIIERS